MKIILLFSLIFITILFIGRKFVYSAKRNLFKDQAAWSGKDIKIKYNASTEISESKGNENFLKIIADESKIYLDDQANKDDETL
ncbi:hypothetical protein [Prochlorococcus marinus]|uniref:Uncharacterized protein n=1 Tax=Prochlorococcus marinus XMU1408 TaxID=2213228 RepID=A0A318R3L4_PROMR|nr:hypothetical protein [Prochlorococcus marinus]MBW3042232.1 hypothetical protein [Prochlorococcus marinus str. XMU1408]PYE01624.1 hypothetical protein DNJ73_05940 [Prochlorococcus marinus XMU1408]